MKWISSKQAAELGKSLAAIVLALVIGALFILVAGESPATADSFGCKYRSRYCSRNVSRKCAGYL